MNTHYSRLVPRARRDPMWGDTVAITLFKQLISPEGETRQAAKPIEFEPMKHDGISYEYQPTITVPMEVAQALVDELWREGLRPTEGTGSAGALAAVQKHLEDMRKLVFSAEAKAKP